MLGGSKKIYGRHNGQFAECEVLKNFQGLWSKLQGQEQGQGLVNWSSMILEDKDFPRGLQRWSFDKLLHITFIQHDCVQCDAS